MNYPYSMLACFRQIADNSYQLAKYSLQVQQAHLIPLACREIKLATTHVLRLCLAEEGYDNIDEYTTGDALWTLSYKVGHHIGEPEDILRIADTVGIQSFDWKTDPAPMNEHAWNLLYAYENISHNLLSSTRKLGATYTENIAAYCALHGAYGADVNAIESLIPSSAWDDEESLKHCLDKAIEQCYK